MNRQNLKRRGAALLLIALLATALPDAAFAQRRKGKPPPGPTPTAPTPTPPNTSAAAPDETIDNRFVTVALQLGDGRGGRALDIYTNALIHSNARIATSQGFYTASVRGSSGLVQNPLPGPTPYINPSSLIRNDPPPKTAVDWGWAGNKKAKKARKSNN